MILVFFFFYENIQVVIELFTFFSKEKEFITYEINIRNISTDCALLVSGFFCFYLEKYFFLQILVYIANPQKYKVSLEQNTVEPQSYQVAIFNGVSLENEWGTCRNFFLMPFL